MSQDKSENARPAQAEESSPSPATDARRKRRRFLKVTSSLAMAGGLAAGDGTFGAMAGRFLYPTGDATVGWQFVATVTQLGVGESLEYVSPGGAKVVLARQGTGTSAEDFVALSSVCPHLGCQVHWEPQNDRFFCPCHNGVFNRQGRALEGPPAKAGQELTKFPIQVENGLIYVKVPLISVGQQVAETNDRRSPRTIAFVDRTSLRERDKEV